jgi:uncharacterized repeat protein (TIGR03803 family)
MSASLRSLRAPGLACLCALGLIPPATGQAGTLTTLATFNGANGASPTSLLMDGRGNLFGTANGGPLGFGTVFELPHGSHTITTLASFNNANGWAPTGLVMDGRGNLFGTTRLGGAFGQGVVFELPHGSHTVTALASFDGANGAFPFGGVILDGRGNLFGTAELGGSSHLGVVFELPHGSHTVTDLASFGGANGAEPLAGVIRDGQGNLFGTANRGGGFNLGTVFELAQGSHTLTTLASFDGTNGARPSTGVILDGRGNLFGTTQLGGAFHDGTVFELSPIPEPSTLLLAGGGLLLLGGARRCRRARTLS